MTFVTKERLYHNADKSRLVREGEDAAFLAYPVGAELSDAEAKRAGVLDFYAAEEKQAEAPANKMAARPADKAKRPEKHQPEE